jgi:hypothetical protein
LPPTSQKLRRLGRLRRKMCGVLHKQGVLSTENTIIIYGQFFSTNRVDKTTSRRVEKIN